MDFSYTNTLIFFFFKNKPYLLGLIFVRYDVIGEQTWDLGTAETPAEVGIS